MRKYRLLAPGPTPIPPEVLQALSRPILHHRTPEFEALFARVRGGLARLLETRSEVMVLAASGTGAMEAAVVNLLSPGDEAIVVSCGKFGERWTQVCHAFGIRIHAVEAPYGETVPPGQVADALGAHPGARVLFVTQSETSTGVLQDIEGYAAVTRRTDTLLVVDTVSSFGVVPCPMDAWGIDGVVAGSQKGLMCPPGLAFVALNDRGWQAAARATSPRFYWDLPTERTWQAKGQAQYTPAVSLLMGLDVALGLLEAEGLPEVYRRHDRLARAARAGAEALGLVLFARATPSPAVTAIQAPAGVDGEAIVRAYGEQQNLTIAGGQGQMKGKIFRLAHLGYVDEGDLLVGLAALERILLGLGLAVELGAALGAAQKVFTKDA